MFAGHLGAILLAHGLIRRDIATTESEEKRKHGLAYGMELRPMATNVCLNEGSIGKQI